MESRSKDFIAPLGQARRGRLVCLSGASGITLLADPAISNLARGHFTHPAPCLEVKEGTLILQWRRAACSDQAVSLLEPLGEIRLNPSIPWEIEFRNGVSHLNADLAQLQLRSLDILGGANQIQLRLARPSGTAFIYISGGIRQSVIRAPSSAEIRVQLSGGFTHLIFEDQRFEAIEGETSLESLNFESATSRYEIVIADGARNITIERSQ